MRPLKPHQVRDIPILIKALSKYGAALNGSDTGTGKTLTFLRMCRELGALPCVVTRKSILPGWLDELEREQQEALFVTNYESAWREGFRFSEATRSVVREAVEGKPAKYKTVFKWRADQLPKRILFCFDEAHGCRTPESINSKMLHDAAQRWKTVMMTATPFTTPLEAFPIGNALRMFGDRTWYNWLHNHGCRKGYGGRHVFIGDLPSDNPETREGYIRRGNEVMSSLCDEIFPDRGCRTRHAEIPGFPETIIGTELVDTGAAQEIERVYLEELEAARAQDLENVKAKLPEILHPIAEPLRITVNLRCRQEAELLKVPVYEEFARNAADLGYSVIVYLNFDASIEAMAKRLRTKCIVRGPGKNSHDSFAERYNWIVSFQKNNEPFIIVNSSANAGLNLHDPEGVRPRYSVISPPWSAVTLKQILGRPHRLGGARSVQKLVFARNTVEERVCARVQSRLSFLDSLTDTDFTLV